MKDDLAQRLLASVMKWEEQKLQAERHELQTLSDYKYDGYENFEPGVKFIESLARWLHQFKSSPKDREIAYQFIRERLIFVSGAEMLHLVRMLYPDVVRPIIRERAAKLIGIPRYQVAKIEGSAEFQRLRRRSLFLGMSDGARIDAFRRSSEDLDNEQIYGVYEIGSDKLSSMHSKLRKALGGPEEEATFQLIFLIDDFAGTGKTILRWDDKEGVFDGRLKRISDILQHPKNQDALDPEGVEVVICLYMATEKAISHLEEQIAKFDKDAAWTSCRVKVLQVLDERLCIGPGDDPALDAFLDEYYSPALEDRASYRVGANGIKYGFGGTGLPLVLSHNTPNNSLYLLWKDGNPEHAHVPLFGRFERHREPVKDGDGNQ